MEAKTLSRGMIRAEISAISAMLRARRGAESFMWFPSESGDLNTITSPFKSGMRSCHRVPPGIVSSWREWSRLQRIFGFRAEQRLHQAALARNICLLADQGLIALGEPKMNYGALGVGLKLNR